MVCLILTLLLPNLIPLFSGKGGWSDFVKTVIGIFISCITRDAFRLRDREKGYFGTTYLSLLTSKISLFGHFVKSSMAGLITNGAYSLFAGGVILILMLCAGKIHYPSLQSLNPSGVLAFFVSCPAIILFAYGLGNSVALAPFTMRENNYFFFLSLIPMAIFIISGWYYPPEKMFAVLSQIAFLNPLTYLSVLLDQIGDPQTDWGLVSTIWCLSLWFFGSSLFVLGYGYYLVQRGKRLPLK